MEAPGRAGGRQRVDTDNNELRPYSGVRLVDLTVGLGSYCARLFADLGAEVIRVEPPGGSADRRAAPLFPGVGAAKLGGIPYAFLNTNKKSVVLDLADEQGRSALRDLVEGSQIVVMDADGTGRERLADIVAVAGVRVVTAISYFGLSGPYSAFVGCDLVAQAMGGLAWLSGEPGRPPLRLAGHQSLFVTSLYAAAATAAALWDVETARVSHVLDVSAQECIAHSLQNAVQVYDLEGRIARRGGEGTRDATEGAFVCQDGYVFVAAPLTLSNTWTRLLDWMDEEGFRPAGRLRAPEWSDRTLRATEPFRQAFREIFEAFVAGRTRKELGAVALNRRLIMAPVNRIADLEDDPQLIFRRYFHKVGIPGLEQEVTFPGAPYRLSRPVWRIESGPPELGADNAQVFGGRSAGRLAAEG